MANRSGFGRRLQTAAGSASRSGIGTQLPNGSFQSVNSSYAAESQCAVPKSVYDTGRWPVIDEFGEGVEDVSLIADNSQEDELIEPVESFEVETVEEVPDEETFAKKNTSENKLNNTFTKQKRKLEITESIF